MRKDSNINMKKPDIQALNSYLRYSYLGGEGDFFRGFPSSGKEPVSFPPVTDKSRKECLDDLCQILDRIFARERKHSDAAFLSSGVDSSLIAFGINARHTFSVAYVEEEFDESSHALETARILGSNHHVLLIGPKDYFGAVREAMACREKPTGDASYITLYLAAKEVAKYTKTVCSGEGPDEIFCGYPCYSHYFRQPEEDFWLGINTIMDIGDTDIPGLPGFSGDGFRKMNAFDLTWWMKGNIIPNVVGAAKGAGIDIRMPYMDPELFRYALSLPPDYKADKDQGKLIFREAAARYTGRGIAYRPKRGFPVPVKKWMQKEPWKGQIIDTLTGQTARDILGHVDREGILQGFYKKGQETLWKQIWEMYVLIEWFHPHR